MGTKKKIVVILTVVIILGFVGFAAVRANQGRMQAGLPVKTVEIAKQDIESHVLTTGEVLAIDKMNVTSDVTGKIWEVSVEKGQKVSLGDILVKLDGSEINYQLQQAEIRLAIEKDTLGQLTKKDKLDLEIAFNNTEIQYHEASNNYNQMKELYNAGAASQNELNLAKNKMDQLYNTYTLAKKNLENADDASQITIQKKQLELSQLNVNKLQEEKDKYFIKSPMDGIIVELSIVEGGILSSGMPMMVIMDTNRLEITTNVSEYDVHRIKIGDPVKITGDAIEGQEYEGRVKYIAPTAISISTGQGKETVVEVKIEVNSQNTALKPGFSTTVDILTETKKNTLVIPYEALFTRKDGQKLIFTMVDGMAKSHEIRTGLESDLVVEVIGSDIGENDKVILNPTENLKDGDPVKELAENDKNKESK